MYPEVNWHINKVNTYNSLLLQLSDIQPVYKSNLITNPLNGLKDYNQPKIEIFFPRNVQIFKILKKKLNIFKFKVLKYIKIKLIKKLTTYAFELLIKLFCCGNNLTFSPLACCLGSTWIINRREVEYICGYKFIKEHLLSSYNVICRTYTLGNKFHFRP